MWIWLITGCSLPVNRIENNYYLTILESDIELNTNGEIIKKKNDYVVAGETIVSGLIHNKETVKTKVCAKGLIYGKTWYKVRLSLENTTLNTVYTSNEKKALILAEKKVREGLKKDEHILDKKILKNNINNSKIDIEVFIVAEENITSYFDISGINIDELNKKEE